MKWIPILIGAILMTTAGPAAALHIDTELDEVGPTCVYVNSVNPPDVTVDEDCVTRMPPILP